jgi:hypothetical protein
MAGRNRVVLRLWVYNAPNVKTIDIYWNNGKESFSAPASFSKGRDSLTVSIPDLEEKSYSFEVYATDGEGNRSLPVTGFCGSYGDMFQSSLMNQPIQRLSRVEEGGLINWSSTPDYLFGNEIRYPTKDGELTTIISKAGSVSRLPDIQGGSKFTYHSVYIPEPDAIDTFYTDWVEYGKEFPELLLLESTTLSVHSFSDETPPSKADRAIDNDLNTMWHSFEPPPAPLPHWMVIDMGKSRDIGQIEIWRNPGSAYPDTKTVQFLVGDDPAYNASTWKDIGTVEFTHTRFDDLRILDVLPETDSEGRYLKLFIPDSYRSTYIQVAEVYIYVR